MWWSFHVIFISFLNKLTMNRKLITEEIDFYIRNGNWTACNWFIYGTFFKQITSTSTSLQLVKMVYIHCIGEGSFSSRQASICYSGRNSYVRSAVSFSFIKLTQNVCSKHRTLRKASNVIVSTKTVLMWGQNSVSATKYDNHKVYKILL